MTSASELTSLLETRPSVSDDNVSPEVRLRAIAVAAATSLRTASREKLINVETVRSYCANRSAAAFEALEDDSAGSRELRHLLRAAIEADRAATKLKFNGGNPLISHAETHSIIDAVLRGNARMRK